jgi:hypothetical protein
MVYREQLCYNMPWRDSTPGWEAGNMTVPTLDQVIVGKISLSDASGQISLFAPPQSFAWLTPFSAEELAAFFTELLAAVQQSQASGDWSAITEVVEAWKATANIMADGAVAAGVEQGLTELAAGQGAS